MKGYVLNSRFVSGGKNRSEGGNVVWLRLLKRGNVDSLNRGLETETHKQPNTIQIAIAISPTLLLPQQ